MLKSSLSLVTITMLVGTLVFAEAVPDTQDKVDITIQSDGSEMSMDADASAGDVAKKLANPVAAMISLPIQGNYVPKVNGHTLLTNVQPVLPFDVSEDWNIISRTIIPVVSNSGAPSTSGIGDIIQSAWLSPKSPTKTGWIWGAGVAFLIPTDSDISVKKWGAGPTGLALKQDGPWTYGGLFNHIWDFGGSDILDINGNVANTVNNTFLQPFLTYITPQAVTFAINTESQYDWERDQWTVPLNFSISKVSKIGNQIISYGAGVTYWAEAAEGQQDGFGVRLTLTFIFPK